MKINLLSSDRAVLDWVVRNYPVQVQKMIDWAVLLEVMES